MAALVATLSLLFGVRRTHAAYWQEFPSTGGWQQIEQIIRPDNLPVPQAQAPQAYYYAIQFGFENDGGCGGYMGIQTDTSNVPAPRKAIFSIWCALGAQSTGIAQPFAGEGEGYQTLIPFPWDGGHEYRLIVRQSAAAEWSSYVVDATAGGAETWIGTIQVSAAWGRLRGFTNNFVEWYGPLPASCLGQPWAAVRFRQPVASSDGALHPIPLDTGTLNTGYGTGACPIPPSPPEEHEGQGILFRTGTLPFCGNGLREGNETCDGEDSTACPGACEPGCTCPVSATPPSPAALWAFDEGAGTNAVDSSGNGHHGEIFGASYVAGQSGSALQFDGLDDYIAFGVGPALSGSTDFTIAVWLKLATGSSGGVVLAQRDATPNGYQGEYKLAVTADGLVEFFVYRDGFQFILRTTSSVTDGEWHHVAAVRAGLVARIYVDGVQDAAVAGPSIKALSPTIAVAAGGDRRDGTDYIDGVMDDLRIYALALNPADVMALFMQRQDVTVSTRKLTMRERSGNPSSRRVSFESRTASDAPRHRVVVPAPGVGSDPRVGGGELRIANGAGSGEVVILPLPAAGWTLAGSMANRTWTYRATSSADPVKAVTVKADRIKFTLRGAGLGYSLDEASQGAIAVRLELDDMSPWCAKAPAKVTGNPPSTARADRPGRFVGDPAGPPAVCDGWAVRTTSLGS